MSVKRVKLFICFDHVAMNSRLATMGVMLAEDVGSQLEAVDDALDSFNVGNFICRNRRHDCLGRALIWCEAECVFRP
jgi:hypothetical protein